MDARIVGRWGNSLLPDWFSAGLESTTLWPAALRASFSVRMFFSAQPSSLPWMILMASTARGRRTAVVADVKRMILKRSRASDRSGVEGEWAGRMVYWEEPQLGYL